MKTEISKLGSLCHFLWVKYDHFPKIMNSKMIKETKKLKQFQIALFNEILDTIVVTRGVEALANGEGRERVSAYL